MDLRYKWLKLKENALVWLVWRLPKKLVSWCYIRVHANATSGQYNDHPDDVNWHTALKRWDNK